MKTLRLHEPKAQQVVDLLLQDEVVALPTDTVYGLLAKGDSPLALRRLLEAKQRPDMKKIPMVVANLDQLKIYCDIGPREKWLVESYLPGPLTLILKRHFMEPTPLQSDSNTLAIRMIEDAFLKEVLEGVDTACFLTSANLSDHPTGVTSDMVLDQLDGRIKAVVMGEASNGLASTIVDCSGERIRLVRPGPIDFAEICTTLQKKGYQ